MVIQTHLNVMFIHTLTVLLVHNFGSPLHGCLNKEEIGMHSTKIWTFYLSSLWCGKLIILLVICGQICVGAALLYWWMYVIANLECVGT